MRGITSNGEKGESIFQGKGNHPCFIDLLEEKAEMWGLRIDN
jgi:hypothetical protein